MKTACSPTPSAEEKNKKNLDINLDPYQALQTDTYTEISLDYNMLNEVGVSVDKPSVVKVDSPLTSNMGERTDYDDIANVVEHKWNKGKHRNLWIMVRTYFLEFISYDNIYW